MSRTAAEPATVIRPLADLGHLGFVLLVLSGLAIAFRRRSPVAVFAVVATASLLYYSLDFPDGPGWIGLFVATYSLTAYGDGRRSLGIAALAVLALGSGWLLAAANVEPRAAIGWVFFRICTTAMSAALGESVRTRRVIAVEAVARAELAERASEDVARARVGEERLRIAREVHDTVAHAIAIINVQAGVAAHVLDKRPDRIRETLQLIERTSADALEEMRLVLGVLRGDSDERSPEPGLAELDGLVAAARRAGLDVTVDSPTPLPAVPRAVEAAIYRIVQESITNVIRHVGPTAVTITVRSLPERVELRVDDEGPGHPSGPADVAGPAALLVQDAPSGAPTSGRGLVGMEERCRLLGGELQAGRLPDGGFRVLAHLPSSRSRPESPAPSDPRTTLEAAAP